MVLYQQPIPRIGIPPAIFERRIKPGERSSYFVTSDWTTSDQTVHYEYDVRLETEKPAKPKIELQVNGVLEHLVSIFEEGRRETARFGVVPFTLGKEGPPKNLSGGASTNQFVLPFLALTTPVEIDGQSGRFRIESFTLEHLGAIVGTGQVVKIERGAFEVTEKFQVEDQPATSITIKAKFRVFGGQLLSAEGSYVGSDGTLNFKILQR